MTDAKGPTLTDARGLGGIIAQDGFDYQVWDALARVPAWLRNPAFEGIAVEVLEDLEARFFAPHSPSGHLLDRFQAKSGTLSRSGVVEVLESFASFEAAHPNVARAQTLVTPALPPNLAWVARDPGRVHRARPFYSPFADIRAASDNKLREDLINEFGAELGAFFADSIEIALRTLPDRSNAEAAFAAAMSEAFPEHDLGARKMANAFGALNDLVAQSRGQMLSRDRLFAVLAEALGVELNRNRGLPVHVRSDRNGPKVDAIEIDASQFAGADGVFPDPKRWRRYLLAPLSATADWARMRHYQRITLSGSYRLSTAFALGWSFRSATGFEIDIPTRSGIWASDDRPAQDAEVLPWRIVEPQRVVDRRLIVGIGVLRNPSGDIKASLGLQTETDILSAVLPNPLADGAQVQASIQVVKDAVSQVVGRLRPTAIDLYYVGPAAFAVALGHRWNALPPTQVHEFVAAERRYAATVRIG